MSLSYDRYLKAGDLFVEYDKDQKSNTDYSELYDSNKLGMFILYFYIMILYIILYSTCTIILHTVYLI